MIGYCGNLRQSIAIWLVRKGRVCHHNHMQCILLYCICNYWRVYFSGIVTEWLQSCWINALTLNVATTQGFSLINAELWAISVAEIGRSRETKGRWLYIPSIDWLPRLSCDYWFNPSIVVSKPNPFLALLLRGGVAMRCTAEWLRRSVTRWWIKLGVLSGRRTRTRHCTTAWFGISYPWHLPSLTKPCPAFLTFVDHLWLSCVGGVELITNCIHT